MGARRWAHVDGRTPGPDLEAQRAAAYARAERDYATSVKPYSGRAVLFCSADRMRDEPWGDRTCGWDGLPANLAIETVPGDHLGILRQPGVRDLAALLNTAVEDASRPSRPSTG